MTRPGWKYLRPNSISHAMELCIDYAKQRRNFSVDRIADGMGLTNKWVIYKWVESGKIPAVLIRPFELACGVDYVSRYIAHSGHKLLIDIPTGQAAGPNQINELQAATTEAIHHLIQFAARNVTREQTIAALEAALGGLAWHRANVETADQPELDFSDPAEPGS